MSIFVLFKKINNFLLAILVVITFYYIQTQYYNYDAFDLNILYAELDNDNPEQNNELIRNVEVVYNRYPIKMQSSPITAHSLSDAASGPVPDKNKIAFKVPIDIELSYLDLYLVTPHSPLITTTRLDVPEDRLLRCYQTEENTEDCMRSVSLISLYHVTANDVALMDGKSSTLEQNNVEVSSNPLLSFLDSVLAPIVDFARIVAYGVDIENMFGIKPLSNIGQTNKEISVFGDNFWWGSDDLQQFVPLSGGGASRRAVLEDRDEIIGYGSQSSENNFVNSFSSFSLANTYSMRLPTLGFGSGAEIKNNILPILGIYDPFSVIVPEDELQNYPSIKFFADAFNALFAKITQSNQFENTRMKRVGIPIPLRTVTRNSEIFYAYGIEPILDNISPSPSAYPNPYLPPPECDPVDLERRCNNSSLPKQERDTACGELKRAGEICYNSRYKRYERLPASKKRALSVIAGAHNDSVAKECIDALTDDNPYDCDEFSVEEAGLGISRMINTLPSGSSLGFLQQNTGSWTTSANSEPWINYLSPVFCHSYEESVRVRATGNTAKAVYSVGLSEVKPDISDEAMQVRSGSDEVSELDRISGTRQIKDIKGRVLATDFVIKHCVVAGALQQSILGQALGYKDYSTDASLTNKWNIPQEALTCDKKEIMMHGNFLKSNISSGKTIYSIVSNNNRQKDEGLGIGIYQNRFEAVRTGSSIFDTSSIFSRISGYFSKIPNYYAFNYAGNDMHIILDESRNAKYVALQAAPINGSQGYIKLLLCRLDVQNNIYSYLNMTPSNVCIEFGSVEFGLIKGTYLTTIDGIDSVIVIVNAVTSLLAFQINIPLNGEQYTINTKEIDAAPGQEHYRQLGNHLYGVGVYGKSISIHRLQSVIENGQISLNHEKYKSDNCFGIRVCDEYTFIHLVESGDDLMLILTSITGGGGDGYELGYLVRFGMQGYINFPNLSNPIINVFPIPKKYEYNGRISAAKKTRAPLYRNSSRFLYNTVDMFVSASGSFLRVILDDVTGLSIRSGNIARNSLPTLMYMWHYSNYKTDCTNYLGIDETSCGYPNLSALDKPTIFDFFVDNSGIVGGYYSHGFSLQGVVFYSPNILYAMTPHYSMSTEANVVSNLYAVSDISDGGVNVSVLVSDSINSSNKKYEANKATSPVIQIYNTYFDNILYLDDKRYCISRLNEIVTGENPFQRLLGKDLNLSLLPPELQDIILPDSNNRDQNIDTEDGVSQNDGSYCEATWCISNTFLTENFSVNSTENKQVVDSIINAVAMRRGQQNRKIITDRVNYMCQRAAENNVPCALVAAIWFQESTFSLSERGKHIFGCFLDGADTWLEQVDCAVISVRNRINEYINYSENGKKEFEIPYQGQDGGTCKVANAFVYTMERYTPIDSKRRGDPRNDCNRGLVRRVPSNRLTEYANNPTRYTVTFADVGLKKPSISDPDVVFDPNTEPFCTFDAVSPKLSYFHNQKPDWSNSVLKATYPNIEFILKEINDTRLKLTKNCFGQSFTNNNQYTQTAEDGYDPIYSTQSVYQISLYPGGGADSASQYMALVNDWYETAKVNNLFDDDMQMIRDSEYVNMPGKLVGLHVIPPGQKFSLVKQMAYFSAKDLLKLYKKNPDTGEIESVDIVNVPVPWKSGKKFDSPNAQSQPGGAMCEIATALAYMVSRVRPPSDESSVTMWPTPGKIRGRDGYVGSVSFVTHTYRGPRMIQSYNSMVQRGYARMEDIDDPDLDFPRNKFVSFLSPTNDLVITNPSSKYHLIISIEFNEKANVVTFKAYFARKK